MKASDLPRAVAAGVAVSAAAGLPVAMITTWRWERDDDLPDGRRLAAEWTGQIRAALDRD